MMNRPRAADLLKTAREKLLEDVRPVLGDSARYTLAMVANAMAIAAREIEAGEAPALAALSRLEQLYGEPPRNLTGLPLSDALSQQERRLARDLRSGHFDRDDDRQRALLEHLRESVIARLRISNPKALKT